MIKRIDDITRVPRTITVKKYSVYDNVLTLFNLKRYEHDGAIIAWYTITLEGTVSPHTVQAAHMLARVLMNDGYELTGYGVHRDLCEWFYQIRYFYDTSRMKRWHRDT